MTPQSVGWYLVGTNILSQDPRGVAVRIWREIYVVPRCRSLGTNSQSTYRETFRITLGLINIQISLVSDLQLFIGVITFGTSVSLSRSVHI